MLRKNLFEKLNSDEKSKTLGKPQVPYNLDLLHFKESKNLEINTKILLQKKISGINFNISHKVD